MPTYLVTDKLGEAVMVEAQRPAAAVALMVADRFTASEALTTAEAIRFTQRGIRFIDPSDTPEPVQAQRSNIPLLAAEPPIAQGGGLIQFDADGNPISASNEAAPGEFDPPSVEAANGIAFQQWAGGGNG